MKSMKIKKFLSEELRYYGELGFIMEKILHFLYGLPSCIGSKRMRIDRTYKKIFGRKVNWSNPTTLNEKIQWLKLYGFEDFHTICADKYRMREYLYSKFGNNDHQIPILFKTYNWKDIVYDNIPDVPCVVKANHTQGDVWIIRDKKNIDIKKLQVDCRWALNRNLYKSTLEPQYKNIKPMIIIEQLLLTEEGCIPNDYKLHFFNGKLEFIYCCIGRESINKRNIYDAEWKPLYFSWSGKKKDVKVERGPEIPCPSSFEVMKKLGGEIAKDFKYVRVDFYEVNGYPYFGEITLHHGSGTDVFVPEKYDDYYGSLLKLQ